MSILSTKTEKIFFTKNSQYSISNKVDLILSPEFYWVRVFDIPVKNVTQAKNVLPTLFEDLLDENIVYSYKAIKLEENRFLCFAYDNKNILDEIKKSNLNTSIINSVYFSQTELKSFEKFNHENESYIYSSDDILVKLPKQLNQDFEDIKPKLDTLNLSSNKIDVKFYNKLISSKQLVSISIVLSLFILINLVGIISNKTQVNEIKIQKQEYISKNSLPSSTLQLNSIVNTYEKNIDIESKKREIYKYLSDNKNLSVSNFSIKNRVVEFKFTNKKLLNQIQNFTKNFSTKITPRSEYIDVRIEL